MGITGRNSSLDGVKRVVSSSFIKKGGSIDKKDSEYPRVKPTGAVNDSVRSQVKKIGPIGKTRKKGTISHQLLVEEDVDLDKQLDTNGCLDERESMWLSSDCLSPSLFFEEHRLSGPFHLDADDWLVSWLSTSANSYLHLDEGSTPLPFKGTCSDFMRETSLSSETTSPDAQQLLVEALKEKQSGITLLLNSPGNDAVDSSVTSPDRAKSCCKRRFEDSPSCDNSMTPPIIDLDSRYQILDIERNRFLNLGGDSLVNLDGEDSWWISDTDSEWNSLSFDCPSPSNWSSCGFEAESSNSGASPAIEVQDGKLHYDLSLEPALEATNLQDLNEDEPIFWPFGLEHDWSSEEAWKCFSMSPAKGVMKLKTREDNSGSTASKILELKQSKNNKDVKKINPKPSRLGDSNKLSVKVVPLEMEDDDIEKKGGKTLTSKSFYTDRSFLEDDFALNEQIPMESFLGLNEFDGHEGVDSNLYEDFFFSEESL